MHRMRLLLVSMGLFLAATVNAQIAGFGYDHHGGSPGELVARLHVDPMALDLGAGLEVGDRSGFSLSASLLYPVHDFGEIKGFLTGSVRFVNPPSTEDENPDNSLSLFLGYRPEVIFREHLALGVRFGLDIPLIPTFRLTTAGDGISVVQAFSFRILF